MNLKRSITRNYSYPLVHGALQGAHSVAVRPTSLLLWFILTTYNHIGLFKMVAISVSATFGLTRAKSSILYVAPCYCQLNVYLHLH